MKSKGRCIYIIKLLIFCSLLISCRSISSQECFPFSKELMLVNYSSLKNGDVYFGLIEISPYHDFPNSIILGDKKYYLIRIKNQAISQECMSCAISGNIHGGEGFEIKERSRENYKAYLSRFTNYDLGLLLVTKEKEPDSLNIYQYIYSGNWVYCDVGYSSGVNREIILISPSSKDFRPIKEPLKAWNYELESYYYSVE